MKNLLLTIPLIFFLATITYAQENTYTITVNFTGMKSDKGKLFVALYNSKDAFLKKGFKGDIVKIIDKKAIVNFINIPVGEYAISAFHDKNNNGKLDTNFLGIPKESIGVSNDAKGFMGPPKYKDAKFLLEKDLSLSITVK